MIDMGKMRREYMRWIILMTLEKARPLGFYAEPILATVQGMYPDATAKEVLLELTYLFDRELIKLNKQPDGRYHAELNRIGVDLVEYTIPCEPGIARPEKYW